MLNDDDLLYRLGLERREWRKVAREAIQQRNAHLKTCRYLRRQMAESEAEGKKNDD